MKARSFRVSDGLELFSSVPRTEGADWRYHAVLTELDHLTADCPARMNFPKGDHYYEVLTRSGAWFAVVCQSSVERLTSQAFLDDLQREFDDVCGADNTDISASLGFNESFELFVQRLRSRHSGDGRGARVGGVELRDNDPLFHNPEQRAEAKNVAATAEAKHSLFTWFLGAVVVFVVVRLLVFRN
eukprot:m51a1_g6778 Vesicle transport protein Sec22B (186) ;mRNA; r:129921-130765